MLEYYIQLYHNETKYELKLEDIMRNICFYKNIYAYQNFDTFQTVIFFNLKIRF